MIGVHSRCPSVADAPTFGPSDHPSSLCPNCFRHATLDSVLQIRYSEIMTVIKAYFDGEKVVLPEGVQGTAPAEVLLVFEGRDREGDQQLWERAQEEPLHQVWDNEEDAIYDTL